MSKRLKNVIEMDWQELTEAASKYAHDTHYLQLILREIKRRKEYQQYLQDRPKNGDSKLIQ
jgi:hypothetical protein